MLASTSMATLKSLIPPARLIGLIALAVLLFLRIQDPGLVQSVRFDGFDFLQKFQPREYTKQPVVIVDIDEASIREHGQWPWPRTKIADLINSISGYGAVATGFDVVFAEPDRLSPTQIANDNEGLSTELKEALKSLPDNETAMAAAMRNHKVVVGETSVRSQEYTSNTQREMKSVSPAILGEDPKPYLLTFPDIVQNMPELEEAASGFGVFTIELEADGIVRRAPLVMAIRDQLRLTLSAELLRIATGGDSFATRTNQAGLESVVIAGQQVTTDPNGRIWIYFSKRQQSRLVSAASILDGSADPKRLSGHMVLVGTSAVGLENYRPTPVGVQMPGVEIHAQIAESILTGETLQRPSFLLLVELAAILLAGLAIVLIVPRLGAVFSAIMAFTMVTLLLGITWWFFENERILIDATFPILTTLVLFVLAATANYIREEHQKRQIRGAFGQYLSPALVDQLSKNPAQLVLGGETRELSVLFSDVRGFTTISESYKSNPQGLTRLMNRFLTVLSQPILERNGTIDKYMGDAVMAFWNAPIGAEDHAYQACKAALEMIENINSLNRSHAQEVADDPGKTHHDISVGVGINTGHCVVGNMGSDTRFDYTALGDAVNLASRLEGQSKPYGAPIIIGETTAKLVAEKLALYEVDLIRVKGKTEPAHIFALAGDENLRDAEDFLAFKALNASMIASYRTQDWTSALDALEMLEPLAERLGIMLKDYLFIYETRIEEFRSNPPGKNWDGVYSATTK